MMVQKLFQACLLLLLWSPLVSSEVITYQIPSSSELTLEPGNWISVAVVACNEMRDFSVQPPDVTLYYASGSRETVDISHNLEDLDETRRRGYSMHTTDSSSPTAECTRVGADFYNNQSFGLTRVDVRVTIVSTIDETSRGADPTNKIFNVSFLSHDKTTETTIEQTVGSETTDETSNTNLPSISSPYTAGALGAVVGVVAVVVVVGAVVVVIALAVAIRKRKNVAPAPTPVLQTPLQLEESRTEHGGEGRGTLVTTPPILTGHT